MSRRLSRDVDYSRELLDDFSRLENGACIAINVTGHTLAVRREGGELIGVRYNPSKVEVPSHQKDREFVLRMMDWKGYCEVPRDDPPFDAETSDESRRGQRTLAADGGERQ